MYLDANNLYGCAMSQYLPTEGFKWLTDEKIDKLDLENIPEDSKKRHDTGSRYGIPKRVT